MKKCLNCGDELTNRWQLKFCSRSCAATYNNKRRPKEVTDKIIEARGQKRNLCLCPCGKPKSFAALVCKDCDLERRMQISSSNTIGSRENRKNGPSNRYQLIRQNAQRVLRIKSDRERKCQCCGFSHHVHVCHKKGIDTFPKDTLLSEVNALDNLVYLCPNCHWMFDHGLLDLN